jgi:hypothetical protein
MEESAPVSTPMITNTVRAETDTILDFSKKALYHRCVGRLMYAASATRPDIAVAVAVLAKHVQAPTSVDWLAMKRVLRYLCGTCHIGITYHMSSASLHWNLRGYSDATWASDPHDRHSVSGYVFMLASAAVAWSSHTQKCVSLSSTEAEYVSLSTAAKDAVWLRRMLVDLGVSTAKATWIYNDNQSVYSGRRTRHIEVAYHHVRERIALKEIVLFWIPSARNAADVLTKPLAHEPFALHRDLMCGCPQSN